MLLTGLLPFALAEEPASSPPAGESAAPEPSPFALSVGTGPRPLNTLTLGLTGMGARILFPEEGVYPWFGGAYNALSVSSGEGDGRYVTALTTWTLNAGVRAPLGKGPRFQGVDPYLGVGAFVNRTGARDGEPADNDWYRTNGVTLGATAAFGLEGYLTPHLSVGLELGGSGGWFSGGAEDDTLFDVLAISTLSAAQLTVWR